MLEVHQPTGLTYEDILAAEGMPPELPFEHEQLPEPAKTTLERAGVDADTDSAAFMAMNGRNVFCTGDNLHGKAEEGVMATPR